MWRGHAGPAKGSPVHIWAVLGLQDWVPDAAESGRACLLVALCRWEVASFHWPDLHLAQLDPRHRPWAPRPRSCGEPAGCCSGC